MFIPKGDVCDAIVRNPDGSSIRIVALNMGRNVYVPLSEVKNYFDYLKIKRTNDPRRIVYESSLDSSTNGRTIKRDSDVQRHFELNQALYPTTIKCLKKTLNNKQ